MTLISIQYIVKQTPSHSVCKTNMHIQNYIYKYYILIHRIDVSAFVYHYYVTS